MSNEQSAPWKRERKDEEVIEATAVQTSGNEGSDPTYKAVEVTDPNTALAVQQEDEGAIASTSRTYSTAPEFKMDELLIPRLRLAQGQTPEVLASEARPGNWVLLGHDAVEEVEVIIIGAGRARERRLKAPGTDDDGKILCRSADAVTGIGDPGIACERCPFADWADGPGGKRVPPACTMIYSYRAFSLTHGALCLLEFKRTGMDGAKLINTMIVTQGMGKFKVILKGTKREAGRNTFYGPQVTPRPASKDEIDMAAMFAMPA